MTFHVDVLGTGSRHRSLRRNEESGERVVAPKGCWDSGLGVSLVSIIERGRSLEHPGNER
jgi:hypothetical protein